MGKGERWRGTIKGWAEVSKAVESPRIFALFKSSLDSEAPSWALLVPPPSDPWRTIASVAVSICGTPVNCHSIPILYMYMLYRLNPNPYERSSYRPLLTSG